MQDNIRLSRRAFALGTSAVIAGYAARPEHAAAQSTPEPVVEIAPEPVSDPATYDAYIPTACKAGDFFQYSCEFDAAWAVLKTFGIDATFDEIFAAIKVDSRIEPYYEETQDGVVIYGGDITSAYSGDYTSSFLARTTGGGMRPVFKHFGMRVTHVRLRKGIERNLQLGRLIWIKNPVDFKDWTPATWITPEEKELPVVLGNDHATVIIGFNKDVVVIRDTLGPTSSNWNRAYEYEVDWETFLRCWAAQGSDGLAVGLPDQT